MRGYTINTALLYADFCDDFQGKAAGMVERRQRRLVEEALKRGEVWW